MKDSVTTGRVIMRKRLKSDMSLRNPAEEVISSDQEEQ